MSMKERLKKAKAELVPENIKTLQNFYTFIIGFSLTQGVLKLVSAEEGSRSTIEAVGTFGVFVAFLFTLVPFYQGMNRHLYNTHIIRPLERGDIREIPLVIDVIFFVIMGATLFAMGRNIQNPQMFFYCWTGLLITDIVWSYAVSFVQESKTPRWAINNLIWLFVAWVAWFVLPYIPSVLDFDAVWWIGIIPYSFVLFEAGRSITDYAGNWEFYFPKIRDTQDVSTKIVYLAGPYSKGSASVRLARFNAITHVAAKLISDKRVVFSPLTMTHPIDLELSSDGYTLESDYWVTFDEAFMGFCEELFILKLPGWNESAGIKREAAYFQERGITARYLEPNDFGITQAEPKFMAALVPEKAS